MAFHRSRSDVIVSAQNSRVILACADGGLLEGHYDACVCESILIPVQRVGIQAHGMIVHCASITSVLLSTEVKSFL